MFCYLPISDFMHKYQESLANAKVNTQQLCVYEVGFEVPVTLL